MNSSDYDFCCDELDRMVISDCLMLVGNEELKNPNSIQDITIRFGDTPRNIKPGEIYLYNEEYHQIRGKPFSFCPFCGASLTK